MVWKVLSEGSSTQDLAHAAWSFHLHQSCLSVRSGSLSQQEPRSATDDNPLFCLPLLTAFTLYLIMNPWGVPGLDWGSGPGHICLQAPGWPFSQACPDNCHISAPAKQCGPHTSPSRGTWVLTTWTRGRYGHISTVLVLGGNNPKWYEHRVDPHCRNSRVSSEAPPHRLSKRCPQAVCSAASARENLWFFRVPDFHVLFQQLKGYCTGPKKHLHYKKVWNSKDNLFHIPKSKIMKGPWKKQTIFTIF